MKKTHLEGDGPCRGGVACAARRDDDAHLRRESAYNTGSRKMASVKITHKLI